jgi:hypothetical protein
MKLFTFVFILGACSIGAVSNFRRILFGTHVDAFMYEPAEKPLRRPEIEGKEHERDSQDYTPYKMKLGKVYLPEMCELHTFSTGMSVGAIKYVSFIEKVCIDLFVRKQLPFCARFTGPDFNDQGSEVLFTTFGGTNRGEEWISVCSKIGKNYSRCFSVDLGVDLFNKTQVNNNDLLAQYIDGDFEELQRQNPLKFTQWRPHRAKILVYLTEIRGKTYLTKVISEKDPEPSPLLFAMGECNGYLTVGTVPQPAPCT